MSDLTDLKRRVTEERAWLIEIDGPRYLSLDPRVLGFWTSDHLLALRFGRREDAENFMSWQDTFDKDAGRIVEHMWTGPRPPLCL